METINASELYNYIKDRDEIIDIYTTDWRIIRRYPINEHHSMEIRYLTIDDDGIIRSDVMNVVMNTFKNITETNRSIRDLIHSRIFKLFEENVPNYSKIIPHGVTGCVAERKLLKDCCGGAIDFTGGIYYRHIFDTDIFDFSNIDITFHKYSYNQSSSNTFDFIRVDLPIIRRKYTNNDIIEEFKRRKNEINKRVIRNIQYAMKRQSKEYNIPMNFFECTDLTLRKDSVLQYTFDIRKEISQ